MSNKKWQAVTNPLGLGDAYIHPNGLRVICTQEKLDDGNTWEHISVSRADRLPTWEEIVFVKEEFMGTDVEAIQAIPARKDYVNVHQFCLHIWRNLDGVTMPY